MIWLEMFGNGVKTDMIVTVVLHRRILQVLRVSLTASTVAVAGSITPWNVSRFAVEATRLTSAAPTLGSAYASPSNDFKAF